MLSGLLAIIDSIFLRTSRASTQQRWINGTASPTQQWTCRLAATIAGSTWHRDGEPSAKRTFKASFCELRGASSQVTLLLSRAPNQPRDRRDLGPRTPPGRASLRRILLRSKPQDGPDGDPDRPPPAGARGRGGVRPLRAGVFAPRGPQEVSIAGVEEFGPLPFGGAYAVVEPAGDETLRELLDREEASRFPSPLPLAGRSRWRPRPSRNPTSPSARSPRTASACGGASRVRRLDSCAFPGRRSKAARLRRSLLSARCFTRCLPGSGPPPRPAAKRPRLRSSGRARPSGIAPGGS